MHLKPDVLAGASVVGGVVLLALLSRFSSGARSATHAAEVTKTARELVAQALEWHRMSAQDESPLYAFRHATLAMAYMNSARLLCCDDTLQRATGIDVHETQRTLDAAQRKKLAALSKKSPPARARKGAVPISAAAAVGDNGTSWI